MKIVELRPGDEAYLPPKAQGKRSKLAGLRTRKNVGYYRPAPLKGKLESKHSQAVERNSSLLPVPEADVEKMYVAKVQQAAAEGETNPTRRQRFAALETSKEIAARVLGAGGSFTEAADWVGISATTVAKYYADPDVRQRVEEYKTMLGEVIGGRILGSIDRLTGDAEKLDGLSVRDRMALYDRFESRPAGREPVVAQQNNLTINSYPEFMERLAGIAAGRPAQAEGAVDDARAQGGGFPVVGADGLPVAGDVPPGD